MGTNTMTNDQLVDIKLDLNKIIVGWSDNEIQSVWYRFREVSKEYVQMGATKYTVVEAALNNAIGAVDYKAGNTQENLSQWVAQLERALKRYEKFAIIANGYNQIAIGAIRDTRPQARVPIDNGGDSSETIPHGQWVEIDDTNVY